MSETRTDVERKHIRSHANMITIDRPDSSQLVDLHVYFLPRSFWKDKLNLAYNDAMEEAISAGFIRVLNNLSIHAIRNEIEAQCGNEELFPKEYIFLRSVGRAMTRVKEKQEFELRVKNFRPPQTYAPEIFLLEGRHDDLIPPTPISMHSQSATTFLQNRSVRTRNGKNESRGDYTENEFSDDQWKKTPIASNKFISVNPKNLYSNSSIEYVNASYDAISTNVSLNTDNWKTFNSKEFLKLQEEQERLKKRQNELEKLRQEMERKRKLDEDELIKRKLLEAQQKQKQLEADRLKQQELERQRQLELEKQRQKKLQLERQKANEAATKIQKTYRGFRDRKKVENLKKQKQLQNQKNQTPQNQNNNNRSRDYEYVKFDDNKPFKIVTNNDAVLNKLNNVKDDDNYKLDNEEILVNNNNNEMLIMPDQKSLSNDDDYIPTNENMIYNNNNDENLGNISYSQNNNDDEIFNKIDNKDLSFDDISLKRSPSVEPEPPLTELKPVIKNIPKFEKSEYLYKTPVETAPIIDKQEKNLNSIIDNNSNNINNLLINTEDVGKPPVKQEPLKKQQPVNNDQNKKKPNDVDNSQDVEFLKKKLEYVKSSRLELESVREDLIKRLKMIHNRITLRRKEARDLWKKKYFSEKKKTPPLEEKVQSILGDIESLQKKLYFNVESDVKTAAQTGYIHETEMGSARLTSLKLQQEIDLIRRQVEHAKLRLTTDIKLRNQAETESKALRTELNQTKLNLHHIKNKLITTYNSNNEMVEQLSSREN